MSLRPDLILEIHEQTVRIARAAFPKGNVYMQMRDELGVFYENGQFAELYSHTVQPAITAWRLALITVMQFAENLTDRQAADAVRGRIDWKYALGLGLEDAGFHYSVLSEFRTRLIAGQQELVLLEAMLDCFRERKLLKSRGKQRTDSTHILGSIRAVNRLELVGETLHHTLNVLAAVAPEWLKQQVTPSWFERYGQRIDDTRLPDEDADRTFLAWLIGQDGYYLLNQIEAVPESLAYLRQLPAVQMLRQIWLQQYCWIDGKLHWRLRHEHGMPPAAITILSPYDLEVRYSEKRGMVWVGYKLHLTETCEDEQVHLITHVETTTAAVPDNHLVDTIHEALDRKDLLPGQHLVDAGYPDGENILSSQDDYQVDLVGRIRPDNGWQAREATGYDASQFRINWETLRATYPQGQQSYPRLTTLFDAVGEFGITLQERQNERCGSSHEGFLATRQRAGSG